MKEPPISPLRIGIIVDLDPPAAWQVELYHKLTRPGMKTMIALQNRPNSPWLWRQLAARVPALDRSRSGVELELVPTMSAALALCQRAEMDLVIDCTASTGREIDPSPFRLGMWSLCQDNGRAVGADYAFLDTMASADPSPAVNLLCNGTLVLRSARPHVRRGRYLEALDRLFEIAASLPSHALESQGITQPWLPQPAGAVSPVIALACAMGLMIYGRWLALAYSESWIIGLIEQPIETVKRADLRDGVQWIGPWDNRRYWADPFGVIGDPTRILCEEIDHDHPTGILKELTLGPTSRIVAERRLELGLHGHLSYPFMFASDGEIYCIPESIAADRVIIHRASDTGAVWEPYCVALEGVRAADSTFFRYSGLFWLAYSDQDIGVLDTLSLAWSNSIAGPWQQHRLNPVKIDVRSARPAGTPFVRNGMLMRPAQDCSRTYGGAIAINQISVCTPDAFSEETIEVMRPYPTGPAPHGLHTLSAWGERTLIDGKRQHINPWVLRHKIQRKLGIISA